MGRSAVRADLKRRPRSFALDARYMALIEQYAEAHDLQRSQALRRLLDLAEERLDGETRRLLAIRRAELAKEARVIAVAPPSRPACPVCHDSDLFVELPDGRWRCDNCLANG